MSRWLTRVAAVVLVWSLLTSVTAFATDVETLLEEELPIPEDCCGLLGGIPLGEEETTESHNLRLSNGPALTLEETLLEGCLNRAESIDVAQYRITEEDMSDLYNFFVMKYSDLLISSAFGYHWERGSDGVTRITKMKPFYLFPEEEMPQRQRELQGYIDAYVTEAKQYSNPLEQILFVHDKLVLNCVYASEAAEKMVNGTLQEKDYIYWHPYQLFSGGTVVCQGYAQAFYDIMQELGYEVNYCCNEGHVWNYLKLGDAWYHVDVTWDDPVPDKAGKVNHSYFLRTDASMGNHDPEQWITDLDALPVCDSTEYESGYIFNVSSGKAIVKEETGYRMTCFGMEFVSDSLWTGTVLSTLPQNGKIRYIYMEEPETAISIYTARKDSENILRGGGVSLRAGETRYSAPNSLILYSYTLPEGPDDATDGTIYFREASSQKPKGPTLQF